VVLKKKVGGTGDQEKVWARAGCSSFLGKTFKEPLAGGERPVSGFLWKRYRICCKFFGTANVGEHNAGAVLAFCLGNKPSSPVVALSDNLGYGMLQSPLESVPPALI